MRFSDVIGQEDIKEKLRSLATNDRLGHAILLLARQGTGGLPLALAFAQYLLCDAVKGPTTTPATAPSLFGEAPAAASADAPRQRPSDSCGQCPSCRKVGGLAHPDLHFSYPVISRKPGSPSLSSDYAAEWRDFVSQYPYGNDFDWLQFIGAENRQGKIFAAECVDIHRRLSLKSYEGGLKILVIWMPEYLEKEGNRLLKLIEEPPDGTLLLLIAEEQGEILPTILSRIQLLRLPPLDTAAIAGALVARCGTEPQRAGTVAAMAEGSYREALSLLQHHEDDWLSVARDWLNAILRNGPVAQVRWVDELGKHGREKQKQFLRYMCHLVEAAIRIRSLGTAAGCQEAEADFAVKLNRVAGLGQLEAMATEMEKAAYQVERNANGKILFLALTLRIHHIIRDNSVILVS
jgi:DNA polymerase-3 subunit delta'